MPDSPAPTGDSVLRAMTDDGAFRVITARTTETVRAVCSAQSATGETARWLTDLVTGTVLIRETMAPTLRVQGILKNAAGVSLVADSHPDGGSRGLVQKKKNATGELTFGQGSVLQMMRTLPNGALHTGVVEVPASGGFSAALMSYLQESEQVVSMIAVGSVRKDDKLVVAGGYIVQLLPELGEGPLMLMTERIKDFQTIDTLLKDETSTPDAILDELLYGMDFTRLSTSALEYKCRCSDVRLLASLATLPRADIEEMVRDGTPLEIACDYCGREYRLAPDRLRGLLGKS